MTKETLRKDFIYVRQQISQKECQQLGMKIFDQLVESSDYQTCEQVFTYVSIEKEVDTLALIEKALMDQKKVFVPLTHGKGIMTFHRIFSLKELVLGKFSLLEPSFSAPLAKSDSSTLIVVPGLVFDRACNRIGYGAGYYDRFLQKNSYQAAVGLAYEAQILKKIPFDERDIVLDYLISEKGIYKPKSDDSDE